MKINGYKLRMAQQFLNQLKKELKKIKHKEPLILEMYSNGREQGYHLSYAAMGERGGMDRWACSFSENRNSDQLVVYVGLGFATFEMQGNIPNEDTFGRARYFNFNPVGVEKAAMYIVGSLIAFLPKEVKHGIL